MPRKPRKGKKKPKPTHSPYLWKKVAQAARDVMRTHGGHFIARETIQKIAKQKGIPPAALQAYLIEKKWAGKRK